MLKVSQLVKKGWVVTKEKLTKFIKDKLDIRNVDIERAHTVKRNTGNNDNDEQSSKLPTIAAKLLHYKYKKDTLHEAKLLEIRRFCFKEIFQEKIWK